MYSKKINQLATNLNPQSDDLIPIGDSTTGQLKTTTYNLLSGVSSDGVISGGIVTWTGTGLIFNISSCVYYLNGVRYVSPFTTKTLSPADPTNARIDVFAVNTSGQVVVIEGIPATNPVEPEGDTSTTLGLTNVTINAGATTPNGVSRDLIYDENIESWTKTVSQSNATYNFADTTFAYTGTKSILSTMGAGYIYFNFSKATALDISNFKSISFAIRLNSAWTLNTILGISFYDGLNSVSNFYQLSKTNTVGFNRSLAGSWQLITIPLDGTIMKFKSNSFTTVRIQTQNAAATYRLDTIQLNGGINNPTGGGTSSANSFGFVNGSTGSASSTQATDTLNVVGTGLATTSATGKTLTISVPQPTISLTGAVTGSGTSSITTTLANSIVGISNLSATGTPSSTTYLRGDNTWATVSGGSNIYTADGTLTAARTLTHGGFNLSLVGSSFTNRFTSAGRLLLGTTIEGTFLLDVNADARINTLRIGLGLGSIATNTVLGFQTLNSNTSGSQNIAIGYASLKANTSGSSNIGIGYGTLFVNTIGDNNISIGSNTLVANTTGGTNVAIGSNALGANTTGNNNTAIGISAGSTNITNSLNTYIGFESGRFVNASRNVGVGRYTLRGGTGGTQTGSNNTAIGTDSMYSNTTGSNNAAIGDSSLVANTTGNQNTALGKDSLYQNTTGSNNIAIGYQSGYYAGSGGTVNQTSSNSIYLGYTSRAGANGNTNEIIIGYNVVGLGSNTTILGNSSTILTALYGSTIINATSINASAVLQVDSTTKGFLPPRMTTTQKNAIGTPAQGLMIFDTTLVKLCVYSGTAWETITSL